MLAAESSSDRGGEASSVKRRLSRQQNNSKITHCRHEVRTWQLSFRNSIQLSRVHSLQPKIANPIELKKNLPPNPRLEGRLTGHLMRGCGPFRRTLALPFFEMQQKIFEKCDAKAHHSENVIVTRGEKETNVVETSLKESIGLPLFTNLALGLLGSWTTQASKSGGNRAWGRETPPAQDIKTLELESGARPNHK